MSVSAVRRDVSFDPAAALTGKETYQDAVRMEAQAASLEASGKHMESLQLLEKALQIRCQDRTMTATMPMYIGEVCDAAERLITKSNAYGVKCFKEDDYDTASALFDYGIQMTEPNSFPLRELDDRRRYLRGVTLNNYGCMERRRGHFSDALAFMQRSMECTGEQSPVAFLNMSAVQTQLRLCEDAVESAMRAMQNLGSAPEDSSLLAVAHHNLAMALEPLDATRALEEYQSALSLAQRTMGHTNETTLAIEQNMMRFLQAHKIAEAESHRVLTAEHTLRGSARGGRLSEHQARMKSPLNQTMHHPVEPKDIFPHPFMVSAADPVVQRKVNVTAIYRPPPVQRRPLVPLRSTKRSPLRKDEMDHTQLQTRKNHSFSSRPTPPRQQQSLRRQTPPKPSRLPPVASSFQGPARNSPALAGRNLHGQEGSRGAPRRSSVTPSMGKPSTVPLTRMSSAFKAFGTAASDKGVSASDKGVSASYKGVSASGKGVSVAKGSPMASAPLSKAAARPTAVSPTNRHSTGYPANVDSPRRGSLSNKFTPKYSSKDPTPTKPASHARQSVSNVPSAAQPRAPRPSSSQAKPAVSAAGRSRNLGTEVGYAKSTMDSPTRTSVVARGSPGRAELKSTMDSPARTSVVARGSPGRAELKSTMDSPARTSVVARGSPGRAELEREGKPGTHKASPERSSIAAEAPLREERVSRMRSQGNNLIWYMADRLDMLLVDEEELERKNASSSIIQRAYRAYRARKLLKEMREDRGCNYVLREIRRAMATRKIQRWFRRRLHARWGTRRRVANREVLASEQHKAAVRIQSRARGWLARRKFERLKYYERNSDYAALKVQLWWRQILAKRKLETMKRRHACAKAIAVEKERRELATTVIQSHWRRRKAEQQTRVERMKARELRRKVHEARRRNAAGKIQTWWRLLLARAELQRLREAQLAREERLREHQRKIDAATKLQAFGRMIIVKKEAEPLLTTARVNAARAICKKSAEAQAASKIQRAFRGHHAKLQLKKLRKERRRRLQEARWGALAAVAQRIGRGFHVRQELGRALQEMRMEAIRFSQRERALEMADRAREATSSGPEPTTTLVVQERCSTPAVDQPVANVMEKTETLLPVSDLIPDDVNKVEEDPVKLGAVVPDTDRIIVTTEEGPEEEHGADPPEAARERQGAWEVCQDGEAQNERPAMAAEEVQSLGPRETNATLAEDEGENETPSRVSHEPQHQAGGKGAHPTTPSTVSAAPEEEEKIEEEPIGGQATMEHSESECVREEREKLEALYASMYLWEKNELERLSALEKRLVEQELGMGAHQPEDSTAVVEESTAEPCMTPDAAVQRVSTPDSVPTPVHMPLSALTSSPPREEETQELSSLEEALAVEREKRRCAMANEKRLREARDAICIKANEYRLRKIAAAESPEELKSLIPHPPLSRRRKDLRTPTQTDPVPATAFLRGRREQQALDAARREEMAALNITRVARGYLCRQYFGALKAIMMEYVEYRLDMDREEPPVLDHELLDNFTKLYQGKVEEARHERCVTTTQAFMRAAGSLIMTASRMDLLKTPRTMSSTTPHLESHHMKSLKGFLRIILAKRELAARKRALGDALGRLRQVEAVATLGNFACVVQAKKDRAARMHAVCNYLQENEDRDAAQMQAADKILRFLRLVVARKELSRRQRALGKQVRTEEAAKKVVSIMQICHAKNQLRRRRVMAEEQRTMDTRIEEVLDHAAMQVQRAYRSHRARRLAKEQRNAKKKYWNTIQAQDEEITAAMSAIAAGSPDPTELWASLGYRAAEEDAYEPDWDVEEMVRCVVMVQQLARGWLALRHVNELRQRHGAVPVQCGNQEENDIPSNESNHEPGL